MNKVLPLTPTDIVTEFECYLIIAYRVSQSVAMKQAVKAASMMQDECKKKELIRYTYEASALIISTFFILLSI